MKIKTTYILVTIAVISLVYYLYTLAVDSPHRISSIEAKQRIQKGEFDVILDVRTDIEVQTLGFYPGSVHIPSPEIPSKVPLKYPNKETKILLYCNTGHRARMATDVLHNLGYKNTVYISSGYKSIL
jgi:rhodanese-related sulfurtransferase